MRLIRIGAIDFICCWSGMALAMQLLFLFYPLLLLLPYCGAGSGFRNILEWTSILGMAAGVLIASRATRGVLLGPRWVALVISVLAMTLLPPIGTASRLLAASISPAVDMAVAMTPAMVVGYGLVGLFLLIGPVVRGDRQTQIQRGEVQL
jgi:hypothetical protein